MRSPQSQDQSLAILSRTIFKNPPDPERAHMTEHTTPDGSFNILNSLLQASSLDTVLREKSLFTLLAPTDAAFTKLPAGEIDSLSQERYKDRLVSLLSRHVISTLISSTSLATCSIIAKTVEQEAVAITVQGKWISMHSATGIQLLDASVVGNDLKSSNRVIIPINAVVINENMNASEDW